jgi:hypothetical protein
LTEASPVAQHAESVGLPRPYSESDDEAVADGCVQGDGDAFSALFVRHGSLAVAAMLRELDAPAEGERHDPAPMLAAMEAYLRRNEGSVLRAWSARECSLRAWLCVVARQVARRHAESTPTSASPLALLAGDRAPRGIVATFPTPAALEMKDVQAAERGVLVHDLLERLPPTLGALARLRLRGMDRAGIAAAVGLGQSTVVANLEKIAARLGELDGTPLAMDAYRIVLDAAGAPERTRAAVRTEDDAEFRAARAITEATWRTVRARVLGKPPTRTPLCLDDRAIAGFVDGTMRGQLRARSEGHVGACARCVDEVATLGADLRAVPILREAQSLDPAVGLAAACLASTRFDAARRIAATVSDADAPSSRAARDVERLAAAAALLEGGKTRPRESSGLVMRGLPSDDEAPLVAFEALALGDTHGAFRAIDDAVARLPAAGRLRILAAAAGEDPPRARNLAAELLERPRVDPGAIEDAESVLATPEGRALPREIVVERLRDVLPEVVRAAVARAARMS